MVVTVSFSPSRTSKSSFSFSLKSGPVTCPQRSIKGVKLKVERKTDLLNTVKRDRETQRTPEFTFRVLAGVKLRAPRICSLIYTVLVKVPGRKTPGQPRILRLLHLCLARRQEQKAPVRDKLSPFPLSSHCSSEEASRSMVS